MVYGFQLHVSNDSCLIELLCSYNYGIEFFDSYSLIELLTKQITIVKIPKIKCDMNSIYSVGIIRI